MTRHDGPRTVIAPCGCRIDVRPCNVEGWEGLWSWHYKIGNTTHSGPLYPASPSDEEVLIGFALSGIVGTTVRVTRP